MTEATVSAPSPVKRRPVWSWRRIAILMGFCAFLGGITWCLWSSCQSTGWSSVTVIVRNDVDQQPVPGISVFFYDLNHGMPFFVPPWISQRNLTYRCENPVTTDSLGKATVRIPRHVRPHERIRFGIAVNVPTIPMGLAYRTQEGRLFDDDPIVIWLKPTPVPGMNSPSFTNSPSPPTDKRNVEPLGETP